MKKVTKIILTGCILFAITGSAVKVNADEAIKHPTGLMEVETINTGTIEENDIFNPASICAEENEELASEWEAGGNYYIYNMLSEEERYLWDSLDAVCSAYLNGTDSVEDSYNGKYYLPYVYSGNINLQDAVYLSYIFKYTNPQYYFLYGVMWGNVGTDNFITFSVYDAFVDGNARMAATQNMKMQVDSWKEMAGQCGSDEEKVKLLHDLIINKVDYNYDFYEEGFDENTAYTQSAYSVFCMDKTVCAGYAQAFELMCNLTGIDCIAVTSKDHEWNKVRINDSWYNVDCTWADQSSWIDYEYFERNDAYYDSDSEYYARSHQENTFWDGYLPACTLDSGATANDPGMLPAITQTTGIPTVTVKKEGNTYKVKLQSETPNAIIYYTTDNSEPAPAATKSYKYGAAFEASEGDVVKAVAVCDTYWDSDLAEAVVKVEETETPEKPEIPVVPEEPEKTKEEQYVIWMYEHILERTPSDAEVAGWVSYLQNGGTQAGIVNGFFSSTEFTSKKLSDELYVEKVYNVVLKRNIDIGGKQTWMNCLENGTSRTFVLKQVFDSEESTTVWNDYGINKGNIILTEARDKNYNVTSYVARNYREFLNRRYDEGGINNWCAYIGTDRERARDTAHGFVFSAECTGKNLSNIEFVKMLYRGLLNREGEAAGVKNWVDNLNSGSWTREQVFRGFAYSPEFNALLASYGL